jgi:hypothetical protein
MIHSKPRQDLVPDLGRLAGAAAWAETLRWPDARRTDNLIRRCNRAEYKQWVMTGAHLPSLNPLAQ